MPWISISSLTFIVTSSPGSPGCKGIQALLCAPIKHLLSSSRRNRIVIRYPAPRVGAETRQAKEEAMPIYLVRWPELTASLVRARDEDDLLHILDQVANPEGCEWSVYKGPLFIDFELPATWSVRNQRPGEPVAPDQVVIEDIGPMAGEHILETLQLSVPEGDDGYDMGEAILKKAFPVLQAAIKEFQSNSKAATPDISLPEVDMREALHAEIARMLKASWRKAQIARSTDPASLLAQYMDMPVRLVKRHAEAASRKPPDMDDDPTTGGEGA